MESLGAKPQAEGDFIFWELDSKDFKKEQAASNKQAGTSDKQQAK